MLQSPRRQASECQLSIHLSNERLQSYFERIGSFCAIYRLDDRSSFLEASSRKIIIRWNFFTWRDCQALNWKYFNIFLPGACLGGLLMAENVKRQQRLDVGRIAIIHLNWANVFVVLLCYNNSERNFCCSGLEWRWGRRVMAWTATAFPPLPARNQYSGLSTDLKEFTRSPLVMCRCWSRLRPFDKHFPSVTSQLSRTAERFHCVWFFKQKRTRVQVGEYLNERQRVLLFNQQV